MIYARERFDERTGQKITEYSTDYINWTTDKESLDNASS